MKGDLDPVKLHEIFRVFFGSGPPMSAIDRPAVAASTRSEPRMLFLPKIVSERNLLTPSNGLRAALRLSIPYVLLNERI